MIDKKICGIYKITSLTGRVYIGQSVNIAKRKSDYKCLHNCSEQGKLFNSLKKYGWEKHSFQIIHECKLAELNHLETYYISFYDSLNKETGLNIRGGGDSKLHSDETKEKIRQGNLGKKMSPESRLKMSIAKKGKPSWNKGLTNIYSDGIKVKMGAANIGRKAWNTGLAGVVKNSDETKKRKSEAGKRKIFTASHRDNLKLSRNTRSNVISDETRNKMRESRLKFIQTKQNNLN